MKERVYIVSMGTGNTSITLEEIVPFQATNPHVLIKINIPENTASSLEMSYSLFK